MRCDDVALVLPRIADGSELAEPAVRQHVESCLRCQAELVQYRKLLKVLHQLRTEVLEPVPGLVPDILAAIEAAGERGAIRSLLAGRRAAYVGGIAAATVASAAAGAIVLASRHRHRSQPERHRRLRVAS
jgi:hypothetical protein